jgi:hypothetical protein
VASEWKGLASAGRLPDRPVAPQLAGHRPPPLTMRRLWALTAVMAAASLAAASESQPEASSSDGVASSFSVQWLGSWKLAGCGGGNRTCTSEPWPSALPELGASAQFHRRVFLFGQGLGRYPYVNSSGGLVNGGLPQSPAFDLPAHLAKVRADLRAFAAVAGDAAPGHTSPHAAAGDPAYCCIDWEAAYPMLELGSNKRNMNLSMALAKRGSPTATDAELAQIAVRAFNGAVQRLWLETLTTAQEAVPACNWGFYGLPRIYSMGGGYSDDEKALHDRLLPLLAASDALYPSVYLHYRSLARGDDAYRQNSWLVRSTVQEGRRLLSQLPAPRPARRRQGVLPRRQVVPWVMFEYLTNAPDPAVRGQIVSALDMELQMEGSAAEGCATVLMYEDGTTKNLTGATSLLHDAIVPAADALSKDGLACRASACHGHGRCVANQTACECDIGWTGTSCSNMGAAVRAQDDGRRRR